MYDSPTAFMASGTLTIDATTHASDIKTACAICTEDLVHAHLETVEIVSCNHQFHKSCLAEATAHSPRCPLCRKILFLDAKTEAVIAIDELSKLALEEKDPHGPANTYLRSRLRESFMILHMMDLRLGYVFGSEEVPTEAEENNLEHECQQRSLSENAVDVEDVADVGQSECSDHEAHG